MRYNAIDLIEAAILLKENCNSQAKCNRCVFSKNKEGDCILFEVTPLEWDLEKAEHAAANAGDLIMFEGRTINVEKASDGC